MTGARPVSEDVPLHPVEGAPRLAVNYSAAAAELYATGRVQLDLFKCPPWPDLLATVRERYPFYVHFPLRVGAGTGDAIDVKAREPADWANVEVLLEETGTKLVNLHLAALTHDHRHIPAGSADPAHVAGVTEGLIRDVSAVVRRFGAERVVVENVYDDRRIGLLRPACLPEVISRVVEETGCGLLLDLSHAWLAARDLGVDAQAYVEALPTARLGEVHVSGVRRLPEHRIDEALQAGLDPERVARLAERLWDHFPMTEADWAFSAWAMDRVRSGAWGQPWAVTFEVGGVSAFYELVADRDILAEQIPRLAAQVKGNGSHDGSAL